MSGSAPASSPLAGGAVAASAAAVAVELRGVTKRFGDLVAVDDLTLQVRAGEFVALLGPSGCGKTTCLRVLGGFETPTEGSVVLDGQDCSAVPPNRRDVNTVFQHYGLFEHLSVVDNVAFGLRQRGVGKGERRRRAGAALELVRLPGVGGRRPAQLSGGQQQRVALARALVLEPSVLLLDEPLGALDLRLRKEMQIELKRIHREVGTTFVFVSHDQEEAMAMADRVAVIDAGRLEQFDAPDVVYDRPASEFVASFVGETNLLAGEVAGGGAGAWRLTGAGGGSFTGERRARASGPGARIGVRPEAVEVRVTPPAQAENRLPGTVESVMELGDRRQVVLALDGGARWVSRGDRRSGPTPPPVGASAWASWASADAILFAPPGAAPPAG